MGLDIPTTVLPETAGLTSFSKRLSAPSDSSRSFYSFAKVAELTRALRAGDHDAFRFLHDRWNHRIVRYCFALSAGEDAFAMEVAQATYLRIFKHMRSLHDEAALWNWIACAARSAAIDLRRVNGRYHSALRRFGDSIIRFGRGCSPGLTSESSLLEALERGLFALSEDDRRLLEARYFQGVSLQELAHTNELSARALEARLARARQRLRERIAAALLKDEA